MLEWLTDGNTERDIVESLRTMHPDADLADVLEEVRRMLTEEANADETQLRGWLALAYRRLYQRMADIGDFSGARQALNEIRTLFKL